MVSIVRRARIDTKMKASNHGTSLQPPSFFKSFEPCTAQTFIFRIAQFDNHRPSFSYQLRYSHSLDHHLHYTSSLSTSIFREAIFQSTTTKYSGHHHEVRHCCCRPRCRRTSFHSSCSTTLVWCSPYTKHWFASDHWTNLPSHLGRPATRRWRHSQSRSVQWSKHKLRPTEQRHC